MVLCHPPPSAADANVKASGHDRDETLPAHETAARVCRSFAKGRQLPTEERRREPPSADPSSRPPVERSRRRRSSVSVRRWTMGDADECTARPRQAGGRPRPIRAGETRSRVVDGPPLARPARRSSPARARGWPVLGRGHRFLLWQKAENGTSRQHCRAVPVSHLRAAPGSGAATTTTRARRRPSRRRASIDERFSTVSRALG
jgi:hypothetical protein